jgi:hypothetical protein
MNSSQMLDGVQWLHHDNIAYVFPQAGHTASRLNVTVGYRTGEWSSVGV